MPVENIGSIKETRGKRVIFAAEPTTMSQNKANLKKELEYNGYEVGEISNNENDIENLPNILDQYDAAIHLLSDEEEVTSKSGKGFQELQIQFTAQHYVNQKLISDTREDLIKIFVWHPKSRSASMFEEEYLPAHLHKIQQMEEIDFLRTNFEDFKSYLLSNLSPEDLKLPDAHHFIKGDSNISVYFIYDNSDRESAQPYLEYIKKRGYNVLSSVMDGDIMNIRQRHNSYLKNFDLAIIYADKVSTNWVNMKIMDILKSPGLGREKDILGKAVLMPESKIEMCPLAKRGFSILYTDQDSIEGQIDEFLNKNLL